MKTSKLYRYRVVDVFTSQPLEGNPLAVFPDAAGLSSELMQKIARELNLSETVFLFPPTRSECAARLRIFTPDREMDFAGHPTVGSAYILLDEGMVSKGTTRFAVEENVGPIPINVDSTEDDKDSVDATAPKIWLTTPPIRERGIVASALAADVLGLKESDLLKFAPQILDAGNPTLLVPIADRATVDHISFDTAAWKRLKLDHPGPLCIFAFAPIAEGAYSRMFAPDYGVREDPATGSSTGPLAAYMMRHKLVSSSAGTTFCSEQGTHMGRRSLLHVRIRGEGGAEGIAVGGNVTPLIEATMSL
jgi:trans-2,3-dihydro-3-hydroxyanthranilate isomerase